MEIGNRKLVFVCVLLVVSLAVSGILVLTVFPDKFATYFADQYTRDTMKLLDESMDDVSEVRGLPIDNVNLKIVSQAWMEEKFGETYVASLESQIKLQEEIYKILLIMPADFDLAEARSDQSLDIIAFSSGDSVYIIREHFEPDKVRAKKILAHEITHVLQSEYFSNPIMPTFDSHQAWFAFVEGDAEFTAQLYLQKLKAEYQAVELEEKVPSHIDDNVNPLSLIQLFPYDNGASFVERLYKETATVGHSEVEAWKTVNQAYLGPPSSTEQILHPNKYLSGEEPVKVLGPHVDVPYWRKLTTETFGEHFISVFLGAHIPRERAVNAAEGWGGDSFSYYKNYRGYLFTWTIVWDTKQDAQDFTQAFMTMMDEMGAERLRDDFWVTEKQGFLLRLDGRTTFMSGSNILEPQLGMKQNSVIFCTRSNCPSPER